MSSPSAFLGLDIGGTNLKALAFTPDGAAFAEETAATGDDGSRAWLERARGLARRVLARCPSGPLMGVAAPGLPARDGRAIAFMPGRLLGLERLDWQQLPVMATTVPVVHDAP